MEEASMSSAETGQSPADQLEYRVFTATRPGLSRDVPPGHESLMWVSNSATLIYGERDAVLVDTFLTRDQSAKLADEIGATGKNLTYIYITHGHGDHFFGINLLTQRFPNARPVATSSVVARIGNQLEPDILDGFWRRLFPGQIPDEPGTPESLDGTSIELEGHPLIPIETGYTDTADSTSLHVPSIGLILAGDVVYNGIHPYQAETTPHTRLQWIAALDKLETLQPRAVVAGHKIPDNDDDPHNIAETRQYLRDFIRVDQTTTTARELFDAMIELYPDRANVGSLWGAATLAKTQATNGSPNAATRSAAGRS
jgi:glyoxylase-like metal-dependent hydrolase (beta-lactamase superfamily II)